MQAVFEQHNVTNAVWAMDYSVKIGNGDDVAAGCTVQSCTPPAAVAPLWPGDDRVDWLFYNIFEKAKGSGAHVHLKTSYSQMQDAIYGRLLPSITSASPGCEAGKCNFASKPWGVGAMGTSTPPLPTADRIQFFDDVAACIANGTYPKVKSYTNFDSKDSAIPTTSTDPTGIGAAFKKYLASPSFATNDPGAPPS